MSRFVMLLMLSFVLLVSADLSKRWISKLLLVVIDRDASGTANANFTHLTSDERRVRGEGEGIGIRTGQNHAASTRRIAAAVPTGRA